MSDPTASSGSEGLVAEPPRRRRHPVRTSLIVLITAAVIAGGVMAATGVLGGDGEESPSTGPTLPPTNATTVQEATLTRSEVVAGALGYGEQAPVLAAGDGTLTWLPKAGTILERGETVYSVNEDKVPLLYGSTPLYRTLDVGDEGKDVKMLEKNLDALGYAGFTVDETYTWGTWLAVLAWQEDLGVTETGTVAIGDAVIASGAKRVAGVTAALGGGASGEIFKWTGTERLVSVKLDTTYEDLVQRGVKATVSLPNGKTVKAVVSNVGKVATSQSSGGETTTTLPVTLSVKAQKKLGRYQAAPVQVNLTAETRENVLAVPVNALVAKRGGGYTLQQVTASGVKFRDVKTGMFGDGMVEVSGDGITSGMKVAIPQ